jgi:hypothetical protein
MKPVDRGIEAIDLGLSGLLLDLYPLTIANAPLPPGEQRQFADDVAAHIGALRKIVQRIREADCKPGKSHLFRVTSPIDTVEHCEWCHVSRPCDTFVGERPDRPLKDDQR